MKAANDVNLYKLEGNDQVLILRMIEQDEDLRDTFVGGSNTQKRIINSVYSALIKHNKTTVGFIMLVNNERTNKFEIDMGILKQYRNNGFGTKALNILKDIILHNELDVEVQTEKTNKSAIQTIIKNGFILCKSDKTCNYYMLKADSKHIK